MKVLRLHQPHDLRFHDEPAPVPEAGEELVKMAAVSICGSDLHWFAEGGIGTARLTRPLVLGHEMAGMIVSGSREGERVAIDPAIPCGKCEFCREGNPNFCTALRFAGDGLTVDGGLQEYIRWPSKSIWPLPESISFGEAAVLEALGVGIHSIDLGHLRVGMSVGIFGCGPIGLMMVQLARLAGAAFIVATDRLPQRVEAARRFGAHLALQADDGREAGEILAATHHRGLDVTFEVAGDNAAVETAAATAKPGAKVVLVGIPPEDRTSFQASTVRRKGLTVKWVRRMKHVYPRAIRLVEEGLVDVHAIITHRFPFSQAQQAFEEAANRNGLKVILEFEE
ncbi:MAG TPA: alcohol dehydrogenase catalytic domain-containing protein [Anaerolineaceae bacterium]|nr:alcohol dehydrogenase catalytic domain-containing protein [Anaerolineaceae bacterium]